MQYKKYLLGASFKLMKHKRESSAYELEGNFAFRQQTCISFTKATADRGVLCDFKLYVFQDVCSQIIVPMHLLP
jgi:hypothetical protein